MRPDLDGTYRYVSATTPAGPARCSSRTSSSVTRACTASRCPVTEKPPRPAESSPIGKPEPFAPKKGLLRAYEVPSGNSLLDTDKFSERVTSISLSRTGKVLAAVAERDLRVFIRSSGTIQQSATDVPARWQVPHGCCSSERGLARRSRRSRAGVYVFTMTGGTSQPPKKWIALEPESSGPTPACNL